MNSSSEQPPLTRYLTTLETDANYRFGNIARKIMSRAFDFIDGNAENESQIEGSSNAGKWVCSRRPDSPFGSLALTMNSDSGELLARYEFSPVYNNPLKNFSERIRLFRVSEAGEFNRLLWTQDSVEMVERLTSELIDDKT
jgi:hypothetical protein